MPQYSRERVGMALYMAGLSPKLQFLAGYVNHACYELKQKLILFLYWPMSLWHVESILLNIGTVVHTFRA